MGMNKLLRLNGHRELTFSNTDSDVGLILFTSE